MNEGFAIQTFIHATTDMPRPIMRRTRISASHSKPDWSSKNQYTLMLERETKAAKTRPIIQ